MPKEKTPQKKDPISNEQVEKPSEEDKLKEQEKKRLEEQYQTNKTINKDYFGRIAFKSGLVDFPIAVSKDNKDYLTKGFDGSPDKEGAIFLDYRNKIDDQNLIVYGHYVYKDESKMFSPLHTLKEKDKYEENAIFYLELEREIRTYQVAYVYYYDLDNKVLSYWKTNFKDTFKTYFEAVDKKKMYDTFVDVDKDDKFMTLQTCVRNRKDLRLIIVGKEIVRQTY